MLCDNKWNNSINKNTISIFPHFHKNRNVILPPLCAADVHLPKDDEIIIVCVCVCVCAQVCAYVCVCAAIQSGSLDAHVHRPLSSNSPLLLAIIPFHTLSIPKTVVHRNQQQTLAFLPIISPPLFFITQRSPPLSQSKLSPAEIWIINVWLIKEKGGKEREKGREIEIERSGW